MKYIATPINCYNCRLICIYLQPMRRASNPKRIDWLFRQQLYQQRRQLRAAGIDKHRRRYSGGLIVRSIVHAPRVFRLIDEDNRRVLLHFLRMIEEQLLAKCRVKINFAETEELHPCGTLYFLAHIDRWRGLYGDKVSCNYPRDKVVEELFQHVGLLEQMQLSPRLTVSHERVKHWHFFKGSHATPQYWQQLMEGAIPDVDHPHRGMFGDCLNEAVTNVVQHAYEYPSGRRVRAPDSSWWMFSKPQDGKLFVVVCDLGIGIPAHLRDRPDLADYLAGRVWRDGKMIEAAVGSERSGTQLAHRGKGLPEMLDFCKNLSSGGLAIYSSKGSYRYSASDGVDRRGKFQRPIKGTLVMWDLPLEGQVVNHE
ncbi:ATP-binding protein [Uliginosibacterium sp. 31-12]|uniref:ATP-binding protein n=1 Tax=Uliginosibacterium sp. 31-12 TaxID=3062781 RepID=UPI0026E22AF2|nr:ATP-binding protein [Uliginosibacterium sp. 31-12]MDO6384692.1 ATP-binding protein [Uliginosibacterium sp. 31-12]